MRRLLLFLFGFAAMGVVLYAQARTPISNGSTLPAHCNVGDAFYKSTATAGLYMCSSTDVWTISGGGGSGTVTHTGTLTANHLIVGNGSADILILGSLGTTTTLLHGNAGGAPTFGAVDLAADITGNLGVSHLNSGTSASSSTFWRGDGTWATPTAGTGTVTSVAMTVPTFLSIAGSPVTTTGTLAVTLSGTALPFANGGTGLTSSADDTVMVSSGSAWVAQTVPNCIDTSGNHLNYTQSTNLFSCGTSSSGGGGASLDTITAAAAQNSTRASGNNYGQVFNWALTSNTVTAFAFGETTAATSGTNDNQVIFGLNTLATSTAVPFYIKNYGAANSLRIDDVSGDTTPFIIDNAGQLAIHGAVVNGYDLTIHQETTGGVLYGTDGTAVGIWDMNWDSACVSCVGTTSATTFGFVVNNTTAAYFKTDRSLVMQKTPSTTLSNADAGQIMLASGDFTDGAYRAICAGYNRTNTYSPICFGYVQTSGSGNTLGDFFVATRNSVSDVTPVERLRVLADGTVNIIDLKTSGAATGKKVVCVDPTTGKLYASSTGTDCSN